MGLRLETSSRKHDRFGWDRISEEVKTVLRAEWIEALLNYPIEEIDAAIKAHTLAFPSKCPNEGHIRTQILKARAKNRPTPKPEPNVAPPSKESKDRVNEMVRASFKRSN